MNELHCSCTPENTRDKRATHVSRVVGIDDHLRPDNHAKGLEHSLDHLRRDVRLHVSDVDFSLGRGGRPAMQCMFVDVAGLDESCLCFAGHCRRDGREENLSIRCLFSTADSQEACLLVAFADFNTTPGYCPTAWCVRVNVMTLVVLIMCILAGKTALAEKT